MRKLPVVTLTVVFATCALGPGPGLAAPQAALTYRGHGQDYFNNGPHWRTSKALTETITFTLSADRRRVLSFRGRYAYYCGSGTSTITASSLSIVNGHFGGTGKRINSNGTNYFALSGSFAANRRTATVKYLDDFVYKGRSVKHPYSFAYHSPRQACESRVIGSVKTG